MGALLDRYRSAGIAFTALPDGQLRASGVLTDALRVTIRADKSAILAELAANDAATPEQAAELRWLVPKVCRLVGEDDVAYCLARALADSDGALLLYRQLLIDNAPATPARTDDDPSMRTCRECANLTAMGRCLAASRRESFGAGVASSRDYEPATTDAPRRCGAYAHCVADRD